jgi:hypothetical protein
MDKNKTRKLSFSEYLDKLEKLNCLDSAYFPDQEKLAINKIWTTKDLEIVKYNDLEDSHLDNIIRQFEEGKINPNRQAHLRGLKEEKLRRTGLMGELLYGR